MNKAVRSVAAAALSVLVLAGCTQDPSSAARVDGVTISERSVQQASEAVVAAFGASPAEARAFAVNRVIQGVLAERLARDNGISITEADRAEVRASQPQLITLSAQPGGATLADDWIDISVVAQSLGTEKLVTELAKHEVELNPRYGRWDPSTGSAAGTGSLSVEAVQE